MQHNNHKKSHIRPIAVSCKEPELAVYWMLTDFCNFSCNYCPDFLHSGKYHKGISQGFPTDDMITSFVDKLEELARNQKINLVLSGGEPTLHPMLPYIVSKLRDKCTLCITTNGSRGNDFWKTILPISGVQLSLHPEFTKSSKVNSLSKIIIDSGTRLRYNLSCDANNWEKVMGLYNSLDDEFKPFVSPKVLQKWNLGSQMRTTYRYTKEQYDWILDTLKKYEEYEINKEKEIRPTSKMFFSDGSFISANEMGKITLNDWHNFEGWKCHVGSESINVSYSGDVFAGVCGSKFLGKIDNFELSDDYIICPRNRCTCPADIRANKQIVLPL
jgi:organic radical activating enzyme